MNYTDFDMIVGKLNEQHFWDTDVFLFSANPNYGMHVYVSSINKIDFYLPMQNYLTLATHLAGDNNQGFRDENNRPGFQKYGIRYFGLSQEETAKYQLLK